MCCVEERPDFTVRQDVLNEIMDIFHLLISILVGMNVRKYVGKNALYVKLKFGNWV